MLNIHSNRLRDENDEFLPFVRSPNIQGGLKPEYLVMHFTRGQSAEGAISWLTNKIAKASAHLVIGRDGSITQLVRFNHVAWHAGRSFWEGRLNLNRFSVGIELDNLGQLQRNAQNQWEIFGKVIPDDQVIEQVHKNDSQGRLLGWHTYTAEQMAAAEEVSALLVEKFSLRDVVGHDDISPARKWDPGPAFPMASFRSKIFGQMDTDPVTLLTNIELNIRSGPGSNHDPLPGSPLPAGTRVTVEERKMGWAFVNVLDIVNSMMDLQGWVLDEHLRREDL